LNVLSEIEETTKKKSLPSIGPLKGEIMGISSGSINLRILEIGTLHGYSAILMANFILNVKKEDDNDNDNINTETIITCLEIDQQLANIAKKN
jgi:predicted O-methyltransferase YrrM